MSGATGELTRGGLNRERDGTIQQLCNRRQRGDKAIQQLCKRRKRNATLPFASEKTTRSLSLNSNQVVIWQARPPLSRAERQTLTQ